MNSDDIALGRELAQEHPGLSLNAFVHKLKMVLDWDRFDYEEGMLDLMQVAIAMYASYCASGGVVALPEPELEEQEA